MNHLTENFTLQILLILMISVLLTGGLTLLVKHKEKEGCRYDAKMMKIDYKWSAAHGCYLQSGDKYIPRDALIPSRGNHNTFIPIFIPTGR